MSDIMTTRWSNKKTFRFIELYRKNPEIWNTKHKYHKDKSKINDAWISISEEMEVPVDELKRKKETLLAAFRLNYKKVEASLKCGARQEVYKPVWVYYDALAAFMSKVYVRKSIFTTEEADNSECIDEKVGMTSPIQEPNSSQASIPDQKRSSSIPPELANTAQIKTALSTINDPLNTEKNKLVNVEEDDCDLYGRLLAKVLRNFNEIDRLELRHEIDGLIIKKKRSLIGHCFKTSPPHIISTNHTPNSLSMYSEQSSGRPSSAQSNHSI